MAWSDLTEFDKALFGGENRAGAKAEKKTVLDHPGNPVERIRKRLRTVDPAEMGVEDEMAAIGHNGEPSASVRRRRSVGKL